MRVCSVEGVQFPLVVFTMSVPVLEVKQPIFDRRVLGHGIVFCEKGKDNPDLSVLIGCIPKKHVSFSQGKKSFYFETTYGILAREVVGKKILEFAKTELVPTIPNIMTLLGRYLGA